MRINRGVRWHLVTLVPAGKEPMEITELRDEHIRVISDEKEADYITGLIRVARDQAEADTRRPLINRTLKLSLDRFPRCIELPSSPLQSITAIRYLDTAAVQQTWPIEEWIATPPAYVGPHVNPPRTQIWPRHGFSFPSTLDQVDSVEVEFVAGYGLEGKDVPDGILHGMKQIGAEMYIQRKESLQDVFQHPAVVGARRLFKQFKLH